MNLKNIFKDNINLLLFIIIIALVVVLLRMIYIDRLEEGMDGNNAVDLNDDLDLGEAFAKIDSAKSKKDFELVNKKP